MATKDYRPSTLLAVIEAIQSDKSLTKGGKTNFTTGIKTFCRCVGRDPSEIDANPVALRALKQFAKPKLIGIGTAHFRNSFSRLKKSLEHVGIPVNRRRNMPLSPTWEALLSPLARDKRADLRKLAGRCSALGIEPDALTQQVFEDFTHFSNSSRSSTMFANVGTACAAPGTKKSRWKERLFQKSQIRSIAGTRGRRWTISRRHWLKNSGIFGMS